MSNWLKNVTLFQTIRAWWILVEGFCSHFLQFKLHNLSYLIILSKYNHFKHIMLYCAQAIQTKP